ncbi:DUF2141 domain-containing protein [Jejudonia soesokkakensis]|uniref:DUF2141 domain-containing protein n=1 Tax=Jejudonia soesokkakensis TaxID=1323432 RepID=A0ABW2MV37_9FLAO
MQTVITYLAIIFGAMLMSAQNTVEVHISNLSSNDGNVKVGLYNSAATFLEKQYKGAVILIENKKASVTFSEIPDGVYAVSFYHDEDEDNEFDMIMGMIPKEDYGCSNNAKGMFGPPKFEDAKFELTNGMIKKVDISL